MKLRLLFKKANCCSQQQNFSKIYFNARNNSGDKSQQSCKQNILVRPFELESFHSRPEFMKQLVDFKITLFQSNSPDPSDPKSPLWGVVSKISCDFGGRIHRFREDRRPISYKKKVYGFKSIQDLRAYCILGNRLALHCVISSALQCNVICLKDLQRSLFRNHRFTFRLLLASYRRIIVMFTFARKSVELLFGSPCTVLTPIWSVTQTGR